MDVCAVPGPRQHCSLAEQDTSRTAAGKQFTLQSTRHSVQQQGPVCLQPGPVCLQPGSVHNSRASLRIQCARVLKGQQGRAWCCFFHRKETRYEDAAAGPAGFKSCRPCYQLQHNTAEALQTNAVLLHSLSHKSGPAGLLPVCHLQHPTTEALELPQ